MTDRPSFPLGLEGKMYSFPSTTHSFQAWEFAANAQISAEIFFFSAKKCICPWEKKKFSLVLRD